MPKDSRANGSPDSEVTGIAAGNADPTTVLALRPEEVLSPSMVKVEYNPAGTTEASLELYDEEDGTEEANLEDRVDKFYLSPGDEVVLDDVTYRDIEQDVVALADGGQDAEIVVTIGGYPVTG